MTAELAIGDRAYSSWSLRGWLLFDRFGIPVTVRKARMFGEEFTNLLNDFQPAKLVPAARVDGDVIWDSLALAEELWTRNPGIAYWPKSPEARAFARSITAEMHSGFGALRSHCAMNLRQSYTDCAPTHEVVDDLRRLELLWAGARRLAEDDGPYLFGAYTVADAFYAPIAARIAGHNLAVDDAAEAYVAAHLSDPSFRRWRAMAHADGPDQPVYARDWPTRDWPGPAAIPAKAVASGSAINDACPFSGEAITHLAEIGGKAIGFCNAFCRDKAVADPAAWDILTPYLADLD